MPSALTFFFTIAIILSVGLFFYPWKVRLGVILFDVIVLVWLLSFSQGFSQKKSLVENTHQTSLSVVGVVPKQESMPASVASKKKFVTRSYFSKSQGGFDGKCSKDASDSCNDLIYETTYEDGSVQCLIIPAPFCAQN